MNHKILTVRIMSCEYNQYWYDAFVGLTVDVIDCGMDYVVLDDYLGGYDIPWRHIQKEDCDILGMSEFSLDS